MSEDMIGGGTRISWLLIALWARRNPQHWRGVRRFFWLYVRGYMGGRRYPWVRPCGGYAFGIQTQREIESATRSSEWQKARK